MVVVGGADQFVYPGDKSEQWIIDRPQPSRHIGTARLCESLRRRHAVELARNIRPDAGRIRKWIHSQAPDGTWREVEYGLDLNREQYYVQPTGGTPIFFDELTPETCREMPLSQVLGAGEEQGWNARGSTMIEQNGIEIILVVCAAIPI